MSVNIEVDYREKAGKIRPLNGVCCAPYRIACGKGQGYIYRFFREGNIPYCRTHDCCGTYGGGYFIDVPNIFRNFDADENDPASYDFYYSDEYVTAVINSGCEIYYRLGVTIEWGSKKYASLPPKDFEKWARICEHIVMHYNEGWADGFKYGIKYWEIWNEPENPGNANGKCQWGGTNEEFFKLYEIASKHLKNRFPDIKIGGYGSCGFYEITRELNETWLKEGFIKFFDDFTRMVKEKNCPFDFFSWHIYTMDEQELLTHAKYVREALDKNGFEKTEAHLNEWNMADEGTGFRNKHTMEGGSFLAAVMCMLQNTDYVDKAMYYCFSYSSMYNGFFDQNDMSISSAWYPFAAFGRLYALGNAVKTACKERGIYAAAAQDADNHRAMLISNYSCDESDVTVLLNESLHQKEANITIINDEFCGEYNKAAPTPIENAKIKLNIPKHTVAYIEFI